MKCPRPNCDSLAPADANYCAACGATLHRANSCRHCWHANGNDAAYCANCGYDLKRIGIDDSFVEYVLIAVLRLIQRHRVGFTHWFMQTPSAWLGVRRNYYAAEDFAYLFGLMITYIILFSLNYYATLWVYGILLVPYAVYRICDIFTYELEIIFIDRLGKPTHQGGHLLSVDRRVILLLLHIFDFIGCYAILYKAIFVFSGQEAFGGMVIDTPFSAMYFSVIVATFTGLSAGSPSSDLTRLVVITEIMLEMVLFSILFATVVGSMSNLTEQTPRPARAKYVFPGRETANKEGIP